MTSVSSRLTGAAALAAALAVPCVAAGGMRVQEHLTSRDGLPSDYVRDVLVDGERLWVATLEDGLAVIGDGRVTEVYSREESGLPTDRVFSLARYGGRIWAGGDAALASWDGETWTAQERIGKTVMQNVSLTVDEEKNLLWAAALNLAGGLVAYDGQEWSRFGGGGKGIVNNVSAVAFGGDTLWLGSRDSGVSRITDGQWQSIRQAQGLRTVAVTSLETDGAALWVGTAAGLGRLEEGAWHWFTREEGLVPDSVLDIEVIEDAVLVATVGGLYIIDKQEFSLEALSLGGGGAPPRISRIRRDPSGEAVWVATSQGLYRVTID